MSEHLQQPTPARWELTNIVGHRRRDGELELIVEFDHIRYEAQSFPNTRVADLVARLRQLAARIEHHAGTHRAKLSETACPFCHSEDTGEVENSRYRKWMTCNACQACGPVSAKPSWR